MSDPRLETEFAYVACDGAIVTVTLNRPARLNALNAAAHHALSGVFDALPDLPGVRVVIVTGAGDRAFCAGQDLKDSAEANSVAVPETGFAGLTSRTSYPLPLIAAVNGAAFGGGFELALACDIIVAGESARFALPEPKVGLAALGGGVQRLPRAIGLKRAMDIILTGRIVSAQEGKALGIVSEVTDDAGLQGAARRWAEMIAACAPLSIRCSKEVAYASLDRSLKDALDVSRASIVSELLESDDAKEGVRAFAERRAPVWIGR